MMVAEEQQGTAKPKRKAPRTAFKPGHSGNPKGRPRKHPIGYVVSEIAGKHARRQWSDECANSARVYIFEAVGIGRFKIGIAHNVKRRLSTINSSSPWPLTLYAEFPGGRRLEAQLHDEFCAYRSHGEWFQLTPEQVAGIAARYGTQN